MGVEESSLSPKKIKADLSINDADLDGAMSEQAGLYIHYATLSASAQLDADRAKNRADVARAVAYKQHRSKAIARGIKSSEALLEAEVNTDPSVVAAMEAAALSRMKANIAKEALEAFKQRKDMLVQKGVSRRVELQGELFIKGSSQGLEQAKERARRVMAGGE